jgi:hypothetical protein
MAARKIDRRREKSAKKQRGVTKEHQSKFDSKTQQQLKKL